ncbi:MAG: phosphate transport system permease protein [Candidatus Tokpelaia sp. JSC188]|nr:MAG: phosphate transport system permease protein [Candidatus Tokpelaia sp. JSC188]
MLLLFFMKVCMSVSGIIIIVLVLGFAGFFLSYARACAIVMQGTKMHSRPHYYGLWTFLLIIVPSLFFLFFWNIGSNIYTERRALTHIPYAAAGDIIHQHNLILSTIRNLVNRLPKHSSNMLNHQLNSYASLRDILGQKGVVLDVQGKNYMVPIVIEWVSGLKKLRQTGVIITFVLAIIGFLVGFSETKVKKRARNRVERVILLGLLVSSTLAILTTIAIVSSMLLQTISFFRAVPLSNFFLSTAWNPRFSVMTFDESIGEFGLIPLLVGTLYIAFVAMLFAVPIGLFSAVYTAEYATPRARDVIKPMLEILAGIPTIVYGFFALIVVGPFLRDLSAAIMGGNHAFIMAQSVLTAGLVMGIMLTPFVSSLSDDIITAVPRSLRDGSLGLGATQSETIKRVVLPAALPGIVAALLLTASRAIGETMIVVLAAGVTVNLTLNPFEAMTTITVKIVNQLTGDLEFNSPQTLVAFALGMTLFVLTLLMNVFALYIVRKYQERYE